ncbi:MAG TPA: branched-chain amino acid aminotransferase, partial [Dehalococcoidia bacterium]|nr:branched-chain amino acid aminotransferase [Dehalococcoidia bacterium]
GSTTNIFLVSCQMLITPSIESGALPGITRQAILELAQTIGVRAVVKQVELGELVTAREAFLTNSILEIIPLTHLNNKPIGSGKPGNLTRQLMSAYRELVAKETSLESP